MNPLEPNNQEKSKDKDHVTVFNTTTGEMHFCKKNQMTQQFEIIATACSAPKLVRLAPKFSKVCTNTFEIILYAVNENTNKLEKFIFKNNDFIPASDCHCDGCKLNVHSETSSHQEHSSPHSLIPIGAKWFGCHLRGEMTTYVDILTGIVGQYQRTLTGSKLLEENKMVRMLPSPDMMDVSDHIIYFSTYCPHIEQNIYVCTRGENDVYLTFNRRTLQFESIQCGCQFKDSVPLEFEDKTTRLLESFPSFERGKYIGIFCSINGNLNWKEFSAEKKEWSERSGKVMDCRRVDTRDLLIRYHFYPNEEKPDACYTQTSKYLFTESSPLGNIYWMVDKHNEIRPFQYDNTYKPPRKLVEVSELALFKTRSDSHDLLRSNGKRYHSYEEFINVFNSHSCDRCYTNTKILIAFRDLKEDPVTKAYKNILDSSSSPPNFLAPPPPASKEPKKTANKEQPIPPLPSLSNLVAGLDTSEISRKVKANMFPPPPKDEDPKNNAILYPPHNNTVPLQQQVPTQTNYTASTTGPYIGYQPYNYPQMPNTWPFHNGYLSRTAAAPAIAPATTQSIPSNLYQQTLSAFLAASCANQSTNPLNSSLNPYIINPTSSNPYLNYPSLGQPFASTSGGYNNPYVSSLQTNIPPLQTAIDRQRELLKALQQPQQIPLQQPKNSAQSTKPQETSKQKKMDEMMDDVENCFVDLWSCAPKTKKFDKELVQTKNNVTSKDNTNKRAEDYVTDATKVELPLPTHAKKCIKTRPLSSESLIEAQKAIKSCVELFTKTTDTDQNNGPTGENSSDEDVDVEEFSDEEEIDDSDDESDLQNGLITIMDSLHNRF